MCCVVYSRARPRRATRFMLGPEQFLLDHLSLIERIIASIGRRSGLDAAAIEEFAAEVKLRLVADDYAKIRAYKGRSSFATYVSAVVAHILLDLRNHEWGKWHASAEAERLGSVAIELERHLYRDGRTLDDAYAELARKHPEMPRSQVDALSARLPQRMRRRTVELNEASAVVASGDVDSIEHAETAQRISNVVSVHIAALPKDDQLLLRLRFSLGMTVAQISRAQQTDQQALYRRLHKLFDNLRGALEGAGIAARDVADLIGKDTVLDFRPKNDEARPSQGDESEAAGRKKENR